MNYVSYVTQEMWDRAQAALRAALPFIEERTPPLSTAGTMVSLRDQVRGAIHPASAVGFHIVHMGAGEDWPHEGPRSECARCSSLNGNGDVNG